MAEEYLLKCWFCNCEYNAEETSFCSHIDATFICPYCLKCACDAPEEYKIDFKKKCPKKILEEKLIRESKTSLKLGEMLIRAGKITRNNLFTAIEKQKSFNKRIGQIFILMNLITPEELSLYLMEQKWIDRLDLQNFELDFELVEMIGKDFCLEKKIIPIETYELNQKKILRLVIFSRNDLFDLKNCDRLKDYILIPYDALPEDFNRLLLEIMNYDIMLPE